MKKHYDIIIAGFGAAGGQLLHQFVMQKLVPSQSVLVIDKLIKTENDRTWCYWEKGAGLYDDILTQSWQKMAFSLDRETCVKTADDWKYKQLEAHKFYEYIRGLALQNGVDFIQAEVLTHLESDACVEVETSIGKFQTQLFFSSLTDFAAHKEKHRGPWLHQHFVGWFVKTDNPVFDTQVATLMDFNVAQNRTEFMYMLPDSSNTALIEHTLFSETLLSQEEYETAIRRYLTRLNCGPYEIVRKEKGVIPMTDYPFHRMNSKRVIFIGSAGGWTRASTGYTFRNSGVLAERITAHFKAGKRDFRQIVRPGRYLLYDRVMLDVLQRRNELGPQFLYKVYSRNPIDRVFRFLDGNSTFAEEMMVVLKSSPRWELIKSVIRVALR